MLSQFSIKMIVNYVVLIAYRCKSSLLLDKSIRKVVQIFGAGKLMINFYNFNRHFH